MKSKNSQKVVLKALGHILYGSNFIASDVTPNVGTDRENADLSVDMQQDIVSIQCTETNPFRLVSTQILQMPLP